MKQFHSFQHPLFHIRPNLIPLDQMDLIQVSLMVVPRIPRTSGLNLFHWGTVRPPYIHHTQQPAPWGCHMYSPKANTRDGARVCKLTSVVGIERFVFEVLVKSILLCFLLEL